MSLMNRKTLPAVHASVSLWQSAPSVAALLQVLQVVTGGMHTMALTDDFQVWTTGVNDEGALGRPTGEPHGCCVSDPTPSCCMVIRKHHPFGARAVPVHQPAVALPSHRPSCKVRTFELVTVWPITDSGPAPN